MLPSPSQSGHSPHSWGSCGSKVIILLPSPSHSSHTARNSSGSPVSNRFAIHATVVTIQRGNRVTSRQRQNAGASVHDHRPVRARAVRRAATATAHRAEHRQLEPIDANEFSAWAIPAEASLVRAIVGPRRTQIRLQFAEVPRSRGSGSWKPSPGRVSLGTVQLVGCPARQLRAWVSICWMTADFASA